MGGKWTKYIKRTAVIVVLAALVWFFFTYAVKWVLPFIIAFVVSAIVEPCISILMHKMRVKRSFAAFICTFAFLVIVGAIISVILWRGIYELTELLQSAPGLIRSFSNHALDIKQRIFTVFDNTPEGVESFVSRQMASMTEKFSQWMGRVTGEIVAKIPYIVSCMPECVLCVITTIISIFFFTSRFDEIKSFIKRQLPEKYHDTVSAIKNTVYSSFGKWLRSELILSLVTFLILSVAFCLLHLRYSLLLALLIALVDALPILGTGMILLPWAFACMLDGDIFLGVGLIITYAVIVVVHNCLEPKLLSRQFGASPVVTIMAMYLGYKTFGISGMILFPILFMILKQLNDNGYIRLWK